MLYAPFAFPVEILIYYLIFTVIYSVVLNLVMIEAERGNITGAFHKRLALASGQTSNGPPLHPTMPESAPGGICRIDKKAEL